MRMIAGGVFDRHPNLNGGDSAAAAACIPLPEDVLEAAGRTATSVSDIFLEHFLIDTASVKRLNVMGSFGLLRPYGLGPLKRSLTQPDASEIRSWTERTSREMRCAGTEHGRV